MSTYICPYCFRHEDTDSIWFQCANQTCVFNDEARAEFVLDRPLKSGEVAPLSRYVFPVDGPGWFGRWFGEKAPRRADCDVCGVTARMRACPHCHSPFPSGIENLSPIVIAVVGSKTVGKSNYIAVLIQRIRELYARFQWDFVGLDDETDKLYKRVFARPLYEEGKAVAETQTGHANFDVRRPLLYTLGFAQGKKYKAITLAFFDTAGEDLSDKQGDFDVLGSMAKINRYIYNASGIIILIDPLNIREVREKVIDSGIPEGTMSPKTNTVAGSIIERVDRLIQYGKELSRATKITIPLAVTFSKIDLLKNNILSGAPIYQKSRHDGFLSWDDFQRIDSCIQDWVDEYDKHFMSVTGRFKDVAFFGISALGGNPDEQKKLAFAKPNPIRVEDPLLWLLWKNGVVDKGR